MNFSRGVPGESNNNSDARKLSTLSNVSDRVQNGVMGIKKSWESPNAATEATECAQVYVGSFEGLERIHLVMIRLLYGMYMPEMVDQITRVRFVILIIGPYHPSTTYLQLGRSMSTLMSNQV